LNLEALDQQGEDKQNKSYEDKPEGKGRNGGDDANLAQQANQSDNNADPKNERGWGSKFHLHSPLEWLLLGSHTHRLQH
jgi:hypothetical protein